MEKKTKSIDPNSKSARFFKAYRVKGLSKSEAARSIGSDPRAVAKFEKSQTYQVLEQKYKDRLESKIGIEEVATEHAKIIKQDRDMSTKLNAIKFYKEQVEPEVHERRDDEKMIVVLRA